MVRNSAGNRVPVKEAAIDSGSMSGVAAADYQGGREAVQFRNGVVIYQGAEAGLMANINIELHYIRYEPMGADSSLQPWIDKTWRPDGFIVTDERIDPPYLL